MQANSLGENPSAQRGTEREPVTGLSLALKLLSAGPVVILIALVLILSVVVPNFFTPRNVSNILAQIAVIAVVALGQHLVILTRGIDLSVGSNLALAIRNAYDLSFPVIIDTHLTSIFTGIVLFAVGNDQLKGFGISLVVGLIISLFTSLYITRLLFDIFSAETILYARDVERAHRIASRARNEYRDLLPRLERAFGHVQRRIEDWASAANRS